MTFPPTSRLVRAGTLLPLSLLLITRLAVGLLYGLSVPTWEADNEDAHFAYARYLAQHHTLLKADDPEAQRNAEKMQPPLYYILAAALLTPFAWEGPFEPPERNPYLASGDAGVNYALHPPALQDGALLSAQAVDLVRAAGVILTTLSVLFVFLSARCLWPVNRSLVWAATCLYAFWPQFLFTGSMITNDVLLISLSAVCLYLSLTLITKGPGFWRLLLLVIVLGCALLTKLNALALLPVTGLALLFSLRQARWPWWKVALAGLGVGLLIALTLWVLLSQIFLAKHFFQIAQLEAILQSLTAQGSLSKYLGVLGKTYQFQFKTFLASYGWGNVETYVWLYPLWAGLFGLFGLGWAIAALRHARVRSTRLYILIWIQALSHLAATTALALSRENPIVPGRYLLPALPAIVFLLLGGWQQLVSGRWQTWVWKSVSVGIVLIGWSIPLSTLLPTYAYPQPASEARLRALQPVHAILDNKIELIGYEPAAPIAPGQHLTLTLCWQSLQPIDKNYTVFLDIVGPDGQGYGGYRTFPGQGNYATSFWKINTPFCEPYKIPVDTAMPAPVEAKVLVRLGEKDVEQALPLTQPGGQPNTDEPGQVTIPFKVNAAMAVTATPQHATTYRFGDELILRGYDVQPGVAPHPSVNIILHWEAVKDITANYVVFVHLRDTPTHLYAQGDSEPRQTWYPTPWWKAGETVLDEHLLNLPAGTAPPLELYVGVYNSVNDTRLPVIDAQGHPVVNNEVILVQNLILP